jgi:hypothetical protein
MDLYRTEWHRNFMLFLYIYIFSEKNTTDHLPTLTFVNCGLPVTLLTRNTGDIIDTCLLICEFLLAFHLFKLLKLKCHQVGKCQ